jgi:hypothetical protein
MFHDKLKIFEAQFLGNDLKITDRIDATFDVNNFLTIKRSNDLKQAINGSNMTEESVTKTFALRCTSSQTGNVENSQGRWDSLLRLININ